MNKNKNTEYTLSKEEMKAMILGKLERAEEALRLMQKETEKLRYDFLENFS